MGKQMRKCWQLAVLALAAVVALGATSGWAADLTVTIAPPEAVAAGAEWRVDGGPWLAAGAGADGLALGAHQVEFKDLAGWIEADRLTVYTAPGVAVAQTATFMALPLSDIGSISPQIAYHGESLQLRVASTLLGPQATLSMAVAGSPTGLTSFDATTGIFSYLPSPTDTQPFAVTFTAASGSELDSQEVEINPSPRHGDEQKAFGVSTGQPLPNPESKAYLSQSSVNNPGTESFNNVAGATTRTVTITGKTVVFQAGHVNGLYESYNSNGSTNIDIKKLVLQAETVIIRSPLWLPQTNVEINARELRFEGPAASAYIKTTPTTPTTKPAAPTLASGSIGLKAGDIGVQVDKVYVEGNTGPRLVLQGGQGGPGGDGLPGNAGRDVPILSASAFNSLFLGQCITGISYNELRYHIGTELDVLTYAGCEDQDWNDISIGAVPSNGSAATAGGKSGDGGPSGIFNTNVNVPLPLLNLLGGQPGQAPTASGGRAGSPTHSSGFYMWENSSQLYLQNTVPGANATAPAGNPGLAGSSSTTGHVLSWLTPSVLRNVLAFANDLYLAGYYNQAEAIYSDYANFVSLYQQHPGWATLPENQQLELQQMGQEMATLLDRLANKLDYFSNPVGWVPMLSFEVNKLAFESEIDRAFKSLYLAYWVSRKGNDIQGFVDAMGAAQQSKVAEIADFNTRYNTLVSDTIPWLQTEAATIEQDLIARQAELKVIEAQLLAKAKKIVDARKRAQEESTFKKLTRCAGTILSVCPFGAPMTQAVGAGLLLASKVDEIKDFDSAIAWGKEARGVQKDVTSTFTEANFDLAGDVFSGVAHQMDPLPLFNPSQTKDQFIAKAKTYGDNVKTLYNVSAPMFGKINALKDSLKKTGASKTEVGAELDRIRASDPALNGVIDKIATLMAKKEQFAQEIIKATQEMATLQGNITSNYLAIGGMDREIVAGNAVLDKEVMQYVDDMKYRAKERLQKYHYFMAKAYEYRLLKAYPGTLNLDSIMERMLQMVETGSYVKADGSPATSDSAKSILGPNDYAALKALYDEQLAAITMSIFNEYNANKPERTSDATYDLSAEQIAVLNSGTPLTLNLKEVGLFYSAAENVRIVDIKVKNIGVSASAPLSGFANLTVDIAHSGESKLNLKGETYLFRHYNAATENPIVWGSSYNAINQTITQITPSAASSSLLYSLLQGNGVNVGNPENLLLYSRPAAWADLSLTKSTNVNGTAQLTINSLQLEVQYDFATRPPTMKGLAVKAPTVGSPYISLDSLDKNSRQNGVGDFYRSYATNKALVLAAPPTYGIYTFDRWTDGLGNNLSGMSAMDAGAPVNTTLQLTLAGDLTVIPVYRLTDPDSDGDGVPDSQDLCQGNDASGDFNNNGVCNDLDPAPNTPPEISGGASIDITMSEDGTPTPFALTLDATDANGDPLNWSVASQGANGTATVSGSGLSQVVAYQPNANFHGNDSFVVQVDDGQGGTDTVTVQVTVTNPAFEALLLEKAALQLKYDTDMAQKEQDIAQLRGLYEMTKAHLSHGDFDGDEDVDGDDLAGFAGNFGADLTADNDGDSYTELEGDCNDTDNSTYPFASDLCGDGIDSNCDGGDGVAGEVCP